MPTFGDLLNWNGSGLRAAAEALLADAQVYNEVGGDLQGLSADDFKGRTAEEEATARRVLVDDAEDLAKVLQSAGNDLNRTSYEVDGVADRALAIQTEAVAAGLTVTDDGPQVPNNAQTCDDIDKQVKIYHKCRADIKDLLDQVDGIIEFLRRVFTRLPTESKEAASAPKKEVLKASKSMSRPDESWTPEEVNDYWTAMSPEQQQHIIENYPQWIGNLNGIPNADRGQANLVRLKAMKSEVDAAAREYEPKTKTKRSYYDIEEEYTSEYKKILQEQEKINALYNKFFDDQGNPTGAGGHSLLVLDTSSDYFRVAIGSGDVDNADHVVVATRGKDVTAETLVGKGDGWGRDVVETDRIVVESRNQLHDVGRGEETVAAVTWLDYHAPQNYPEAAASIDARNGADDLASYYEGLQATHRGDPHLTADGHSYGSLITGLAVAKTEVVDSLSIEGSPGPGYTQAEDFALLPKRDMYGIEAKGDAIHWGSIYWREGCVQEGGCSDSGIPSPTDGLDKFPDFTRLEDESVDFEGQVLPAAKGHSQYYDWTPVGGGDSDESATVHTIEGPNGETRYTPNTALHNVSAVVGDTGQQIYDQ